MTTYVAKEITLDGFDGSTDKTDHLIKWVKVRPELVPALENAAKHFKADIQDIELDIVDFIEGSIDFIIDEDQYISLVFMWAKP